MGKMKEMFIDQINSQMGTGDEDYGYEQFKQSKEIEEMNAAHKTKYSDSDVEYVLKTLSNRYPVQLNDVILNEIRKEFYTINDLRYDF